MCTAEPLLQHHHQCRHQHHLVHLHHASKAWLLHPRASYDDPRGRAESLLVQRNPSSFGGDLEVMKHQDCNDCHLVAAAPLILFGGTPLWPTSARSPPHFNSFRTLSGCRVSHVPPPSRSPQPLLSSSLVFQRQSDVGTRCSTPPPRILRTHLLERLHLLLQTRL